MTQYNVIIVNRETQSPNLSKMEESEMLSNLFKSVNSRLAILFFGIHLDLVMVQKLMNIIRKLLRNFLEKKTQKAMH